MCPPVSYPLVEGTKRAFKKRFRYTPGQGFFRVVEWKIDNGRDRLCSWRTILLGPFFSLPEAYHRTADL